MSKQLKLISWNVNGIRAALKKGFMDYFNEMDADVFCLQETKCQVGQVELDLPGYYQYWNAAVKKGYSGTAIFTKIKPIKVTYDLGIEHHDQEGRVITAEFDSYYLVTCYTPNAKRGLERLDDRMDWEDAFRNYLLELNKTKPVVVCGDLNVAHKEFDIKNRMAIPGLVKIVVNMGMGEAISNSKVLDLAVDELKSVTGQQPVVTKAKKSIAAFKLREGMRIGAMVTLRGERMYEFLDRLISVALPRVRDFRGISVKAFDGRGNYTLGVKEQLIFPEIDFNKVDKTRGMNISIVTTADNDEQGKALLKSLGMPFRQ